MNTRFSTYASYWIKQSIRRALVNTVKAIRIPENMVELLARWWRAAAQLQEELGRTPSEQEIARSLDLPKKKLSLIKKAIRAYNMAPQADQPESGRSLDGTLMGGHTMTPDTEMAEADHLHQVLDLLGKMDPREATVLRMRFGLDDQEPKTLQEISERLGVTRERVRQIESKALGRLRGALPAV